MRRLLTIVGLVCSCFLAGPGLAAQQWTPIGPDGGDVRKLVRDPHSNRILLTTSTGRIFESLDSGISWLRLAQIGQTDDYVIDGLIFHPSRPKLVYAAAWNLSDAYKGGVFRSTDGGATWRPLPQMRERSVRALAMAPNNPKVLIAAGYDGVYRTTDGGERWSLISPPEHADLRNFDSIAIDPIDSEVVYAGTWHLPWKTTDGGLTWNVIKNGIVDDSDVFSIIVDPQSPQTVYASACSGIYKSENAGEQFRKVQGIPFSARRTRVLKQDPSDPNIVYAGTTEGLWKTNDAGHSWTRMSATNLIINDVLIDPDNSHNVMLATDRAGVLASRDGGQTLVAHNKGFSHRQVTAVLVDKDDPATIYAGVINDKEFGGVFVSHNSGDTWQQMSAGLNSADVFTLRQSGTKELIAGTTRGLFIYRSANKDYRWQQLNASTLDAFVHDLDIAGDRWLAATNRGLFLSKDNGASWSGGAPLGERDFTFVRAINGLTVATSSHSLLVSSDNAGTWTRSALPANVNVISSVTVSDEGSGTIFLGTREGAYRSLDRGQSWEFLPQLSVNNVTGLIYDATAQRLLAASSTSSAIYESRDNGKTWKGTDAGWQLQRIYPANGYFLATTAFEGIVAQPLPEKKSVETAIVGGGN